MPVSAFRRIAYTGNAWSSRWRAPTVAHADDKPVDLGRRRRHRHDALAGHWARRSSRFRRTCRTSARAISRASAPAVSPNFSTLNANSVSRELADRATRSSRTSASAASPRRSLLGTPQGLSVFQDGVRINEAFGDVVNWDLIPKNAVASMQLLPGSNPVFGLNTLGGALTHAHEGWLRRTPGAEASLSRRARSRARELAAEAGGNDGDRSASSPPSKASTTTVTAITPPRASGGSTRRVDGHACRATRSTSACRSPTTISKARRRCRCRCWTTRGSRTRGRTRRTIAWPSSTATGCMRSRRTRCSPATPTSAGSPTSGVNSNVNDDYAPPEQSNEAVNLFTSQIDATPGAPRCS